MGQWITSNGIALLFGFWWIPFGLIWWWWCGRDPSPDIRDPFHDFEDDGRDIY